MKKILLSAMAITMPYGIIGFLIPLQSAEMGASPLQTGLLFSAFTLLTILIRPLAGRLTDQAGPKPVYLTALGIFCGVQLLYLLSNAYWLLFLARVLQALAASLLSVAFFATVISNSDPGHRAELLGHAASRLRLSDMLGFFLGFFILGSGRSFSDMYLVFFILSLAALPLASQGFAKSSPPAVAQIQGQKSPAASGFQLLVFCISFAAALLSPALILYVRTMTVDPGSVALLLFPGALVGALIPPYAGRLADRLGANLLLPVGLLVTGVTILFLPHLGSGQSFVIGYALMAAAGALYTPALKAMAAQSGMNPGETYGRFFLVAGLAGVAGSLVGSWLFQAYAPWLVFTCSGALTLVIPVFFLAGLGRPGSLSQGA